MKALVLSNNKLETKEISNELESLQSIVSGYISFPMSSKYWSENGILTIVNDEGKIIDGMKEELLIVDKGKYERGQIDYVLDMVFGNIIFVAEDGDNTKSLSDKQIKIIENDLRFDALLTNGKIVKCLFV